MYTQVRAAYNYADCKLRHVQWCAFTCIFRLETNKRPRLQAEPFNIFLQVCTRHQTLTAAVQTLTAAVLTGVGAKCWSQVQANAKEVILSKPEQVMDISILQTSRPWIATVSLDDQNRGAGQVVFSDVEPCKSS